MRIAVDIGGTFTDAVLASGNGDVLASEKTLTTHSDPVDGAIEGVARMMARTGYSLGEVTGFIHGTTLAANALIEKRGARVASVTTEGFRDILEIGYERRYSQYDISLEKPKRLVPRERSFTIRERMSADGEVLIELDESGIDALLGNLDECAAEAAAICFLHSYANPAHERRIRDALNKLRPDLAVTISSEVSPEAREYDRISTTVANAFILPLMQTYLQRISDRFALEGLRCPILMMTAGGGMCSIATASRFPIRLVESGPAGGAILAAKVAADIGLDEVLSFDIGGTTAKLCLIDNAQPQTSRQFEIARAERFIKGSGMPVRIPAIEMIEIGAGGGSIAEVDRLGRLRVGPRSAGSEPGPAAFRRGGTEPTVTDSDIVLGYIEPDTFGDGMIAIDACKSKGAIDRSIASKLETDTESAADGICKIVDESMSSAGRMHAAESGKDLGRRTMIALGGNGPLHASRVARNAGIRRIVVPPNPSVGSAVGFLHAPVKFEIVRSRHSLLDELEIGEINSLFEEMIGEARDLVRQGAGQSPIEIFRSAFMRYSGQGHEIEIPIPNRPLDNDDKTPLAEAFESEYRTQFSRPVPGMKIEILNWAVTVLSPRKVGRPTRTEPRFAKLAPVRTKKIFCDINAEWKDTALIERADLQPGDSINGPALITEPQTTTLVSEDFAAHVDALGNLVLIRGED